jgi:hypothetical protein
MAGKMMCRKGQIMNQEFITKLWEAKKLEREAFQSLIPEKTRKHVEVIENEMKALIKECLFENMTKENGETNTSENKAKKVDIN